MRRGCSVLFIHFHSYPILSRASQEKVREIAALLTRYQQHSRLVMVAFGELQQQVVLAVPPRARVVIYRRLMLRIAERLARKWRARALVTGEVVGQVASQTLENMTTIAEATTLEILRPLVGMDKDEISDQAGASARCPSPIIPDQDCCTLFTPRNPATRARLHDVLHAEAGAANRRDGRWRRGRRHDRGIPLPRARLLTVERAADTRAGRLSAERTGAHMFESVEGNVGGGQAGCHGVGRPVAVTDARGAPAR